MTFIESIDEFVALCTREISVQFNADVADGMPWKFVPTQREVFFLTIWFFILDMCNLDGVQ